MDAIFKQPNMVFHKSRASQIYETKSCRVGEACSDPVNAEPYDGGDHRDGYGFGGITVVGSRRGVGATISVLPNDSIPGNLHDVTPGAPPIGRL